MAISFKNTKGAAQKGAEAIKYKDGENTVRIFGDVQPSYTYWVKGSNNKDIPLECLSFDRSKEKFTNVEVDHVRKVWPELKCSWSYKVMAIDPADGKAKVLHLKKKLFEQIMSAAEDLNLDPTDPDTGFDLVFERKKTGPLAFNVEYTLKVLKLKSRSLTEAERETIANAKSIDELIPRPTADDIKASIDRIQNGTDGDEGKTESAATTDAEAINDLP